MSLIGMVMIGQDGEIRKLRRSCNNLWVHYELKVKSGTNCTYTIIEKWENIVNIKQNAASQESKLKTFCCMLKVNIAYDYGTFLWNIRNKTS